jgi:hypothetical protein
MISLEDFKYHPSDPEDDAWTETLFMIFSVPEVGISGSLYTLARPNLGVCHSSIEIHRGMCLDPWKVHHNDSQMHLRAPDDFSDFELSNGLRFKAESDRDCGFGYESLDGNCALELQYSAVCDPFDPHDSDHNPLAASKLDGYDGWNNGHMDSQGKITGWLRLRDKEYEVNCIDGMDKSWGARLDWGNRGGTWVQINLGDGLGAFLVMGLSFQDKEIIYGPFKFGFLSIDGERRPIIKATMRAQRSDMLVMRAIVEFEDDKGNAYKAIGTTIAAAPWYNFNPSSAAFQTLVRWESGDRVGHSHIADFAGLGFLAEGLADQFDES